MLAGSAELRLAKVSEAHNSAGKHAPVEPTSPNVMVDYVRTCSEVPHHLKVLLTNPTYVMVTLFVCCDIFIIAGFATFGPKYVENQFSLTAAQAGGLFGEWNKMNI